MLTQPPRLILPSLSLCVRVCARLSRVFPAERVRHEVHAARLRRLEDAMQQLRAHTRQKRATRQRRSLARSRLR
jgi:hypothetical protein